MSAPSRWTTPRLLRLCIGAIWLASGILFLVAFAALNADRGALRAIARNTAPSIVIAQDLGATLADLDTELANSLLGDATDRDVADELFELRRSSASRRIVDAASNIAHGDAERIPIVVLGEELGRYLEIAARAQWLYLGGDHEGALGLQRIATGLMHARVLPAANALDDANRSSMDAQYTRARQASLVHETEAFLAGALLLVTLVAAQAYVRRRMRRRVVPLLFAATVLTLVFTGYLVDRFRTNREDLRIARDDAFNSIHLLWRARAVAYDANGDESRWLLDRARAGDYEGQYKQKMAQLMSRPGAYSARDAQTGGVTGLLVDVSSNVTFPGERDAADAAIDTLARVVQMDERMRQFEHKGMHSDAVEVCIGSRPSEIREAFDAFDAAIERTTAINQAAFDGVVALADGGLGRAEWLDPAFALAIALLGWLGIRARLREYA